ncbi:MAG: DUF2071 domain-containing protein [Chitinophagaceae bacterium]|nr:DUF2071 domain-containing protein [Oligoflexus sp.]
MLGRKMVFFDSECATCHRMVQFLIRRPKRDRFVFIPIRVLLESPERAIKDTHGHPLTGDSLVVIRHGVALQRSAAVFAIFETLGWPWRLVSIFRVVPRFLSDFIYDLYARNRYQIMGRADPAAVCDLPGPEVRELFKASLPKDAVFFPTRPRIFLQAEWVNLLFLNYTVPEDVLKPYLPRGTELDLWEGKAMASIVAFEMRDTLVGGLSVPWHEDFEEVNLRFYVKRRVIIDGVEVVRRGVVFIKEIVPRFAIAAVARVFYNENYVSAQMEHNHRFGVDHSDLSYAWQSKRGQCRVTAALKGQPELCKPGSLEEFITEHYWGYAVQRDSRTVEYEVEHPSWLLWNDVKAELSGPIEAEYGADISIYLQAPVTVCVARGSSVRVLGGSVF